eukprot:g2507.t1
MAEPQLDDRPVLVTDHSLSGDITDSFENTVEEYEPVKLEARMSDVPMNEEELAQQQSNESWSNYNITKLASVQPSPSSEIIPEDKTPDDYLLASSRIRISVSNPQKKDEVSKLGIRNTFVSYLIQSDTKLDEFPFSRRSVWRRFRDFDALHKLLRENHRGYVIPPLPSKNYLESKRGNEAFIKERQIDLNKFLCQIVLHPVLYNTEEMKVFLGCEEDLSSSHDWYKLTEAAKKASGTGMNEKTDLEKPGELVVKEFSSLLKKVGKTFKREGHSSSSYTPTETERTLQDLVPKLKHLEVAMTETVEKSEAFVNSFQEVGEDIGFFGRILVTISRFEDESKAPATTAINTLTHFNCNLRFLVNVLQKTGYASVRVQQFCNKQTVFLKGKMSPLPDELSILPAVLRSLQDRTFALRSVYQAQGELESRRRSLDTLAVESSKRLGGTPGFTNKSASISAEIKDSGEEVEKRTECYNSVTNRNLSELERIKQNRTTQFHVLTLGVAKAQQEYYQSTADIWQNLADEISSLMNEQMIRS